MIFPLMELTEDYGVFPKGTVVRFNPWVAERLVKDGQARYADDPKTKGRKLGRDKMVRRAANK